MTVYFSDIVCRVADVLKDTVPSRWTQEELLFWWNDGKRDICTLKPDACSVIDNIFCAAGTRQSLVTADGDRAIALNEIISARNATSGGAALETPVQFIARKELDASCPDWHTATAEAVPMAYTMDRKGDRRTFYVSPPISDGASCTLTASYVVLPEDSAPAGSVYSGITLSGMSDIYAAPLLDYMLFKAFSKGASHKPSFAKRAATHYGLYAGALGRRDLAEAAFSPQLPEGTE